MKWLALAIVVGSALIAGGQFQLYEVVNTGREWVYRVNRLTGAMYFCHTQECVRIRECRLAAPAGQNLDLNAPREAPAESPRPEQAGAPLEKICELE